MKNTTSNTIIIIHFINYVSNFGFCLRIVHTDYIVVRGNGEVCPSDNWLDNSFHASRSRNCSASGSACSSTSNSASNSTAGPRRSNRFLLVFLFFKKIDKFLNFANFNKFEFLFSLINEGTSSLWEL